MRLTWLDSSIHTGSLYLHMPNGKVMSVGEGEPEAHMHINSKRALRRMIQDPEFAVGEEYMAEGWSPGKGGLLALFELYFRNDAPDHRNAVMAMLGHGLRFLREINGRMRSRRNVHHHYDLDADLFRRFLDKDLQYSCAYFHRPDLSLEAAQRAKCEHIARKLCLKPGDRVLDIGCGWGGMALYLAREWGVDVTGVTLSDDQYREACRRAAAAGLEKRVRFLMQDYREHEGAYDAIVSVGMFEHVGRPQYQTYFDVVDRLLKPEGRSLIHSIGRTGPPAEAQSWISRYIFPGGYIPALSEAAMPIERSGLAFSDVEIWRLHYARTLRAWNERFQANRDHFRERLGERFCRMWEFYLIGCQAIFTWGELVVFQMQLAHANNVVPVSRDYLYRDPAVELQKAG